MTNIAFKTNTAFKTNLAVTRPTTLRDQVVGRLREAITQGDFPPGARLIERHMCELLGVSRTLVREGLRQLEAEGLVQIVAHRGPVVASLSASEVRELYEVRAALEGVAARRCAEHASPAQLAEMAKTVKSIVAAQKSGNVQEHIRQVGIFYDQMRDASGNATLRNQLTALGSRLAWLRTVSLSNPERSQIAIEDERRLLAALQKRDGARARQLCEDILAGTAEAVVIALAKQGAAFGADGGHDT